MKKKYPQFNFEVINAAVVHFCFHQSFALYFEKLHDFNPDIIINMDGYNETNLAEIAGHEGDPYLSSAGQTNEELQLATMAMLPQTPYTLAYYNFNYVRQHQFNPTNKNKEQSKLISHDYTVINHQPDYKSYQVLKKMSKPSKKIMWLIASYEKQLYTDGVYSIFCLQPMLKRVGDQKELSANETRFRSFLEKKVTIADTINVQSTISQMLKSNPEYRPVLNELGVDKYWIGGLIDAYFFNDFSPLLDSVVTTNGGAYIDMNKTVKGMGADKEFYVDYCHLTPFGNQFVAEQMAQKVDVFMKKHITSP